MAVVAGAVRVRTTRFRLSPATPEQSISGAAKSRQTSGSLEVNASVLASRMGGAQKNRGRPEGRPLLIHSRTYVGRYSAGGSCGVGALDASAFCARMKIGRAHV